MATENPFLDFNLKMLNLWIGLVKGVSGIPSDFRTFGYKLHSIEQPVRNADGDICKPEMVACSEKLGHSLLFEWKDGPNLVDDQLRRYSRLDSKCLVDFAFIPKSAASKFDVVI